MLRTFDSPFDFHYPFRGRRLFAQLASKFSSRFDSTPHLIDDPIFSYKNKGKRQLERIAQLDESQPSIVYLSNVVMHSALLVVGDCDASDLQAPLQYDSLDAFLAAPYVRGYYVERGERLRASFDDTTIVISDLADFMDDDDKLSDNGLFRVLNLISEVFVCNILDYDKYFEHCRVYGEQAFFLSSNSRVDFEECAKHYDNDTLREFLLGQSAPFATLADDHMDDEFAVSYGMDCWQFSDDQLAFVR